MKKWKSQFGLHLSQTNILHVPKTTYLSTLSLYHPNLSFELTRPFFSWSENKTALHWIVFRVPIPSPAMTATMPHKLLENVFPIMYPILALVWNVTRDNIRFQLNSVFKNNYMSLRLNSYVSLRRYSPVSSSYVSQVLLTLEWGFEEMFLGWRVRQKGSVNSAWSKWKSYFFQFVINMLLFVIKCWGELNVHGG